MCQVEARVVLIGCTSGHLRGIRTIDFQVSRRWVAFVIFWQANVFSAHSEQWHKYIKKDIDNSILTNKIAFSFEGLIKNIGPTSYEFNEAS